MIPDNPDTARQTDAHDFPTPEACRVAARAAYEEALILRYTEDDALDRAADAVYDLLPVPNQREVTYEDLEYDLTVAEEKVSELDDELVAAEDTIRDLRTELADAEEEIDSLRCQLAEADDRITELAKDYL